MVRRDALNRFPLASQQCACEQREDEEPHIHIMHINETRWRCTRHFVDGHCLASLLLGSAGCSAPAQSPWQFTSTKANCRIPWRSRYVDARILSDPSRETKGANQDRRERPTTHHDVECPTFSRHPIRRLIIRAMFSEPRGSPGNLIHAGKVVAMLALNDDAAARFHVCRFR
jgi:hypothetical protein